MPSEGYVLNIREEEAKAELDEVLYLAEAQALDAAVADAKAGSPRLTGKNADSIQKRLRRTTTGTKGTMFTESGYGGLLEVGSRRNAARPYMFPAADKNLRTIPELARNMISNLRR